MKIIHLISDNTPGPSTRMALDLGREMQARGHAVTVMTRGSDSVNTLLSRSGIATVNAPLRGSIDVISPVRLSKIIREAPEGRTVVHVYRFGDAVVAARARSLASRPDVKIVLTRLLTTPAKKGVTASAIYSEIDALTFPAECVMRSFMSTEPDIDRSRLSIIRPAAALPAVTSAPAAVPDSDTLSLLVSGDIHPDKGLDTLVEALGTLTQLRWRLTVIGVGAGPVVMPVIRRSRTLGIADRIDWRGDYGDPMAAAREADIAICPEKKAEIVTPELSIYMAAGTPVIASGIDIHRELGAANPTVGFFEAADADALAAAIADAAARKAARSTDASAPDFAAFASETEQLYLDTLKTC